MNNKKKLFVDNKKKLRIPDETFNTLSAEEKQTRLANTPFLAEDLTPFRNHMFIYIRKWNETNKRFVLIS